jgi:Zn ribbon nucleic-acid-binding protein
MIQAGDGSWQRMLDQDRCPKCRSLMTKLVNEQMITKRECLVCNLTINEMSRDNEKG